MNRFHRRLICTMMCVMLLSSVIGFVGTARADNTSPSGKLDLVILLDDSGSMYKNSRTANDPYSYRYDAASIMLNMCEAEGSRAVIYEFKHTNVTPVGGYDALTPIDLGDTSRLAMTNALMERTISTYDQEGTGSTPLGAALNRAVEALDKGAGSRDGRQPVILILADGNADDPDVLEAAKQKCKERNYKIYTALLGNAFGTGGVQTLRNLASETNGRYFEVADASELPQQFSQVFADQTGAELTSTKIEPARVEGTPNTWEVEISVPNRSVQECNIMIPTAGLSNIQLIRPNGQIATMGSKIYFFQVGSDSNWRNASQPRFQQYKILSPEEEGSELGVWHLRFDAESEAMVSKVSVTVVFNYNLTLTPDTLKIERTKGGEVTLSAWFATEDGNASDDDLLYREDGIICTAYLLTTPDEEITDSMQSLTLAGDRNTCRFSGTFSFMDIPLRASLQRKSGTYYLVLKAVGDGLVRYSAPIEYVVSNIAPERVGVTGETRLEIHNPNDQSLNKVVSDSIDITQYFRDGDGEADIASIVIDRLEGDDIVSPDLNAGALTLSSKDTAGSATVVIKVTDIEGAFCELAFPVSAVSVMDTLRNEYKFDVNVLTNSDANGYYQRGQTVDLKASAYATVTQPTFRLDDYHPEMKLYRSEDNSGKTEIPLDGGKVTVTLDGIGGDYLYFAELTVNGHSLLDTIANMTKLSTGNVPPTLRDGAVLSHDTAEINCDKFPDYLLGYENTPAWTIDFSEIFEDKNTADRLNFAYEFVEGGDCVTVEEITEPDDQGAARLTSIMLQPKAEGEISIRLIATDDSAEHASNEGDVRYTTRVIDRHAITVRWGIIIAVAVILIVILLCVWHAVTRPRFVNVQLKVSVDGVPQKEYILTSNIKKKPMSTYTPGGKQFTGAMGGAMEIRPSRSGAYIKLKKKYAAHLRGAVVRVGTKQLGSKTKELELRKNSDELRAEFGGETMTWKLVTVAAAARPMKRSAQSAQSGQIRSSNNTGLYR